MRLSDYIFERLYSLGVDCVFHVSGRGSLFLTDALAKHKEIKAISMHHEQACAFAAIGYAEKKGGIGVAMSSTGCASTNMITGVLNAWQDELPCLFISGQHISKETTHLSPLRVRTFGQQEADIVNIITPITKSAVMLKNKLEIFDALDEAILSMICGRKGPAWIDIPLDLQSCILDDHICIERISKRLSDKSSRVIG